MFDGLSGGWGLRQLSPTAKELCYCDHRRKKITVAVSVVCGGGCTGRAIGGVGVSSVSHGGERVAWSRGRDAPKAGSKFQQVNESAEG